ncbi:MAG: cardiolipin synthase [Gemmatimonadales bacterium]|nr:MAG: cardiolipin synthase [Gemmatimonadales bacterium]
MLIGFLVVAHLLGAAFAGAALMEVRTPQGTLAWVLALLVVPYLAVPAYWILGPSRFEGYVSARRGGDHRLRAAVGEVEADARRFRVEIPETRGGIRAIEQLARMPVLRGNRTRLLVDGEESFQSLFAGLERAQDYALVQFYTIRDDKVGRRLRDLLLARARDGVRVYVLFDRVGSRSLPRRYIRELRRGGVSISAFLSSRAWIRQRFRPRLQVNFRNHRKIMVVDGHEGWLGGLNASEAYLGRDPRIGTWRDTHLHLEGPSVTGLQLSFLEDWHWSTGDVPELNWTPRPSESAGQGDEGDEAVLVLPSGPADPLETANLMIQHAIHGARERFWLATPYFVPDEGILSALELAVLRGVEVRILVPETADVPLVHLAKLAVLPRLLRTGVQIHRYTAGFMHSKAFLVDDRAAAVGTVNLDNRSLRLNFEVTAILLDPGAIRRVERMLEDDLSRAEPLTVDELNARPAWERAASRAAYLLAPIL